MKRVIYLMAIIILLLQVCGRKGAHGETTYFYTPKEAIVSPQTYNTPLTIYNSLGDIVWEIPYFPPLLPWSPTIILGEGDYSIKSSGKFSVLVGDPISGDADISRGYYILDIEGNPLGTEFYTNYRLSEDTHNRRILYIVSYQNFNEVKIESYGYPGFYAIWRGTLNKGEVHSYSKQYTTSTLPTQDIRVTSTYPVSILVRRERYENNSKYFIPAISGSFFGQEFHTQIKQGATLYVFSYADDTKIKLIDDVWGRAEKTWDLKRYEIGGHYYPINPNPWSFLVYPYTIIANRPITVLFSGSRSEGMTYIADSSGTCIGNEFVFTTGQPVKVFSFLDDTTVEYYGYKAQNLKNTYTLQKGKSIVLDNPIDDIGAVVLSDKPISIMYKASSGGTYVPIPKQTAYWSNPFCPAIYSVTHSPLFPTTEDKKVKIRWLTDEPADSCLVYRVNNGEWVGGKICNYLLDAAFCYPLCSVSSPELTKQHELELDISYLSGYDTVDYFVETESCRTGGQVYSFTISPVRKLKISRESVVDKGDYYTVFLQLDNIGIDKLTDIEIKERLWGFLPVREIPEDCQNCRVGLRYPLTIYFDYTYDAVIKVPEIQTQETLLVSYDIAPLLYGTFKAYRIGSDPTEYIYKDSLGRHFSDDFSDPYYFNIQEVMEKIKRKDYVIATNPSLLVKYFGEPGACRILLKAGEFALARGGVIGCLKSYDRERIHYLIDSSWKGRKERYYDDGDYLLFIGEEEIVPSWRKSWSCRSMRRKVATIVDNEYADVNENDNHKPELIIGRLPGKDVDSFIKQMDSAQSDIFKERVVLISGCGKYWKRFKNSIVTAAKTLRPMYERMREMHWGNYCEKWKSDYPKRLNKRRKDYPKELDIKIQESFVKDCKGADLIILSDHGNPPCWFCICPDQVNRVDLCGKNPIVISMACLTGKIAEDINFTQAFLDHGASVVIGSTEDSPTSLYTNFLNKMMKKWAEGDKSIGYCFKEAKRELMSDMPKRCENRAKLRRIVNEYNLYGDPTRGHSPRELSRARLEQAYGPPSSTINFIVPDYEVDTVDGIDFVSLPGDDSLLMDYEPIVPIYIHTEYIGALYKIQNVSLIERSGRETASGLNLPIEMPDPNIDEIYSPHQPNSPIFPDPSDIFQWDAIERFDGNHELIIVAYPFYYNKKTTDVEFWKNYSFSVEYAESNVEIVTIEKGSNEYMPGDLVSAIVTLQNHGQEDVPTLIKTEIFNDGDDKVGEGTSINIVLPAQGEASVQVDWDSNGVDPGDYFLKSSVTTGGTILDTETKGIRLGTYSAETNLEISHSLFEIGDLIHINMNVSNTGPLPLSGAAKIRIIHSSKGKVVKEFTDEITLDPGQSHQFSYTWDTTGMRDGSYRVLGYLHYDGRITDISPKILSTYPDIHIDIRTEKELYNFLEKIAFSVRFTDSEGNSLTFADSYTSTVSGKIIRPDNTDFSLDLEYYPMLDCYGGWFYLAPSYPEGIYIIEVKAEKESYRKTTKRKPVYIGDGTEEFEMRLSGGWSMISLPVAPPPEATLSVLFPGAAVMYRFERGAGYVRVKENEALNVGSGYWILVYEDQNYVLTGKPILSYRKTVYSDGWEMIGGCTSGAWPAADNCDIEVIYRFVSGAGYQRVLNTDTMESGGGFWILLKEVVDQFQLTVQAIGPPLSRLRAISSSINDSNP